MMQFLGHLHFLDKILNIVHVYYYCTYDDRSSQYSHILDRGSYFMLHFVIS